MKTFLTKKEKIQMIAEISLSEQHIEELIAKINEYYNNHSPDIYLKYSPIFATENLQQYIRELSQEFFAIERQKIRKDADNEYSVDNLKTDYIEYVLNNIKKLIRTDIEYYPRKNRIYHRLNFIFCTDPNNTDSETEQIAKYIFERFDEFRNVIEDVVDDIIENVPDSYARKTALIYVFNSVAEVIKEKKEDETELDALYNNLYNKILNKIEFYK